MEKLKLVTAASPDFLTLLSTADLNLGHAPFGLQATIKPKQHIRDNMTSLFELISLKNTSNYFITMKLPGK
ncbi:MAG: hypothetical protein IIA45_08205 [Bacteroidetes bacterium]|nr:hypothetical protein [Bacteroidota bacterium]